MCVLVRRKRRPRNARIPWVSAGTPLFCPFPLKCETFAFLIWCARVRKVRPSRLHITPPSPAMPGVEGSESRLSGRFMAVRRPSAIGRQSPAIQPRPEVVPPDCDPARPYPPVVAPRKAPRRKATADPNLCNDECFPRTSTCAATGLEGCTVAEHFSVCLTALLGATTGDRLPAE